MQILLLCAKEQFVSLFLQKNRHDTQAEPNEKPEKAEPFSGISKSAQKEKNAPL